MQALFFEKMDVLGFEVTGDFKSVISAVSYICGCGREAKVRPDIALRPVWDCCKSCSLAKRSTKQEDAEKIFLSLGMKLLSKYETRDKPIFTFVLVEKKEKPR